MRQGGTNVESLREFLRDNPDMQIYDYSQLELADQCLRKYAYRYRFNLPDPSSGANRDFSSYILHPLISAIFQDSLVPGGRSHMRVYAPGYLEALWRAFETAVDTGAWNNREMAMTSFTVAQQVRDTISGRSAQLVQYHFEAAEALYWVVLPDIKEAIWVAKPDMILTDTLDNSPVTAEIKFSAYDINRRLLAFDRQLLSQAYATGVKKQLKLHLQIVMTSRDNTVQGIRDTWNTATPDDMLLDEWLSEIQSSIEVIQRATASGIWPKRAPRSCVDFNKDCPMLELCNAGKARHFIIENMEKSNPLAYLGL